MPPEIYEYGLLGLSFAIALKSLDLAVEAFKTKVNGKKKPEPLPFVCTNGPVVHRLEKGIKRIEKVLIDGNSKPGLVTTVALLNQKMEAHTEDENVHVSK